MVNTLLLDEKIKESGLKIYYIVDSLGISRMAFNNKKTGQVPFRKSEIYVLCDLLHLDNKEKTEIFFPES